MNPVLPYNAQSSSKSDCFVDRLPDRKDFLRLRSGKRFTTRNFTLQAISVNNNIATARLNPNGCRVGYTVTTRVGNAVVRNRIKRRLRAAVSEIFPEHGKCSYDYALIARRSALSEEFAVIKQDLKRALDHVHVNRAKGGGKQA